LARSFVQGGLPVSGPQKPLSIDTTQETAMTDSATGRFEKSRGRMADGFKAIIADSEELLSAAVAVPGEGFAEARKKFEDNLQRARTALVDASKPMIAKAEETAAAGNDYVRANPWTAIGVAGAAGLLIGLLAAKR